MPPKRRPSTENGTGELSPSARRFLEEIAVTHRVAISPNDPLAKLQTVNEQLVREVHDSLQTSLEIAIKNHLQPAIAGGAEEVARTASQTALEAIRGGGITAAPDPELRDTLKDLTRSFEELQGEVRELNESVRAVSQQSAREHAITRERIQGLIVLDIVVVSTLIALRLTGFLD